jgi:hypothetical protein
MWRVSHVPLPGTPREARLILVLQFLKEAAARATLGRQGRPRRPVFRSGEPGNARAPEVSDLVRAPSVVYLSETFWVPSLRIGSGVEHADNIS